jgi:hypothetical protein
MLSPTKIQEGLKGQMVVATLQNEPFESPVDDAGLRDARKLLGATGASPRSMPESIVFQNPQRIPVAD